MYERETVADIHDGPSYGDLIVRAIYQYDNRIALIDGEAQITYREFGVRIAQTMSIFSECGLVRGDGLAQLSRNSIDAAVTTAAAWCYGLRYTPLHPMGSLADHTHILAESEARALVVDVAGFGAHGISLTECGIEHVFTLGSTDDLHDLGGLREKVGAAPLKVQSHWSDVAGLYYTGGTTGSPKGVVKLHRSNVTNAINILAGWEWPPETRFLAVTPISHAAGTMMVAIMLRGGTFVMDDGFETERYLDLIKRHDITCGFLVPTMLYRLLDSEALDRADISSLRTMIYGAAPMSPSRLEQGLDRFGPVFMQAYGQTETSVSVTVLGKAEHNTARPDRLESCGTPLVGNQVKVFDDHDEEVDDGEVGEICVRGPLVMEEYWKKPEETQITLRGGWLHTGDMARRDPDGYLTIVDRKNDMIISGGFNVYPRELENVLNIHPDIAIAAVIGVPDGDWGEAVKAIVVPKQGIKPDSAEIIAHVKRQKGRNQAPKSIDYINELPLTPLGKIDKKKLREPYWPTNKRQVN
jgi:fatty-acyl-CoA synthase